MGLLIDTSVLIDFERAGDELADAFEALGNEELSLASISASELLHGVHRANSEQRRARRQSFVEGVFSFLPILPFDLDVARVHARISADLSRQGTIIGSHDLIIAATAFCHHLTVVTGNEREFRRIEGIDLKVR